MPLPSLTNRARRCQRNQSRIIEEWRTSVIMGADEAEDEDEDEELI